jgi:hypothetical protein
MHKVVLVFCKGPAGYQILEASLILNLAYTDYCGGTLHGFGTNIGNYPPEIVNFPPVFFVIPAIGPIRSEILVPRVLAHCGIEEILEVVESYGMS